MSRNIGVALALAVFVPLALPAPGPKDGDKSPVYVPTTVGDKRVYESDYGGGLKVEETSEVTAVERKDGAVLVTVKTSGSGKAAGTGGRVSQSRMSGQGLFLLSEAGHVYDPPVRLLPLPLKEGDAWEWEKPFVKWKFTAGKEEEVEVPAGKYTARRVDGVGAVRETPMQAKPTPTRCTLWYAPDLGVVKSVIKLGDDEIVEVLKSFSPGPAKK